MNVPDCLDTFTDSSEFWTKKGMFTYLVAARAADWKTPVECGIEDADLHEKAKNGVESMLGTAITGTEAYNPEFMA